MRRLLRSAATFAALTALAPGGSNFDWYQVDHPSPLQCVREPYGVVPNFSDPAARARIEDELGQMIASGQRRLRIGLFHGHGFDTGTVMNSAGGDLSPQNRANLAGLLAAVKAAGFTEVEVAFHPEGPAVREWTSWNQALFEENWNTIRNLRPVIRAAHIRYRIDLSNEAIPPPGQPVMLEYARRMWARYTHAFGRADTLGFSVIGDPAHVGQLRAVYGSKPPRVFDIHFYDGTSGLTEDQQFQASDRLMRSNGLRQPWIIGEAFYDDATTARRLGLAIAATRRPIYYLTQWPLTRGSSCADTDVAAPTAFDAYAAAGFADAAQPRPVLANRAIAVDRPGRAMLRIGCVNSATTCSGDAELVVRGRRARRPFRVEPGSRTTVPIPVGRVSPGARIPATVLLSARSLDVATPTRRQLSVKLVATGARGRSS